MAKSMAKVSGCNHLRPLEGERQYFNIYNIHMIIVPDPTIVFLTCMTLFAVISTRFFFLHMNEESSNYTKIKWNFKKYSC